MPQKSDAELFREVLITHGEQLIKIKEELQKISTSMAKLEKQAVSGELEELTHANKNALIVLSEVLKDKHLVQEKELHRKYLELMGAVPEPFPEVAKKKTRDKSSKIVLPKSVLPYKPCKDFLLDAGAERVGDDALLAYNKQLVRITEKIAKKALQFQRKDKSPKLYAKHLRDAYEEILKETTLPPDALKTLQRYASQEKVVVKTVTPKAPKKTKTKSAKAKKKTRSKTAKQAGSQIDTETLADILLARRKPELYDIVDKPKTMTETTFTTTKKITEIDK